MSDKDFRLVIFPALEVDSKGLHIQFNTAAEMEAAKEASSFLLLFVQDDLTIMKDYSNAFYCERLIDGEYIEIEEDEE